MNVLFLITARGGSKGLPGKNMRRIAGVSLVGLKAISARASKYCSHLVVSSDSEDIQREASRYGAECWFTRPAELASDTASSSEVVLHAMEWTTAHTSLEFDAVMLLEPSTPFSHARDYDAAVEMMQELQADAVVGLRSVEVGSAFIGPLGDSGCMAPIIESMRQRGRRRQDGAPEYTMNGALYLNRWSTLEQTRDLYGSPATTFGYIMEPEYSVEIDTLHDLRWAEHLCASGVVDLAEWGLSA